MKTKNLNLKAKNCGNRQSRFSSLVLHFSFFVLLFCASCSSASVQNSDPQTEQTNPNPVDSILEKLNQKTKDLKTYQGQIEYRYVQPVFSTQTLRKGVLYFQKNDSTSNLRVNFQTLQQDDDEEQKKEEQYIIVDGSLLGTRVTSDERRFEGLWLIILDYDSKSCIYKQLTHAGEPNKPVDIFELVSKKFPIVGFIKAERLKEQFEITIPEKKKDEPEDLTQVQFKVKPSSIYEAKYVQIDCWIDEKSNLPVKIKAISTEPEGETPEKKDLSEIKFLKAQINKKIDRKIFDFQIPKGFDEPEIYPLEN